MAFTRSYPIPDEVRHTMRLIRMMANRGVLRIFIAMLLVMTVMGISNLLIYRNSVSEIYGKVNENNKLVVTNMIQTFDGFFKEINNLMHSIDMLPYDGDASTLNTYMMQKSIAALIPSTTMDYIEEVVVFLNGSNLAITTQGTIDFDLLFKQKYKNAKFTPDYWKSFASTSHSLHIFPEADYDQAAGTVSGPMRKELLVVAGSNQFSRKNVLLLIDTAKLFSHIPQSTLLDGTSLSILDQDKNLIMSTENNGGLGKILDDLYFGKDEASTLTTKENQYSFFKSGYNDFIYIEKAPNQFLNLETIISLNPLILLGSILCAVIMAALLSLYLYKPIMGILTLFGIEANRNGDFRKIRGGIIRMQEENEALKTQMTFLASELRKTIFMHAVEGFAHSQEFELRMQTDFARFLQDRQFIMVDFRFQAPSEKVDFALLRIDEITEAFQTQLQAIAGNVTVFHIEGLQFLALVNLHHPSEREPALRKINGFVKEPGIEELKSFALSAAASRAYVSKIKHVQLAYLELREGSMLRNVHADGNVVDMEAIRFTWNTYFPLDKVDKLSNCLMNGNEAEGIAIVEMIMEENRKRNIHHHQFVYISKGLLSVMIKHLERSSLEAQEIVAMEIAFCRKAENTFNYEDIQEELLKTLKLVAKAVEHVPKNKLNPVFIAQYIEMHYMESLYLDQLAEILDTSPKYLSNYFKKTFHVNFVEYLNNIRLTHAKQLLQNTNLSIAEVGVKTGFTHSSTFSSTFKNACGISPIEYRQSSRK